MCCVPCGPRRRSSSRESIIPVERIKKADVEIIICAHYCPVKVDKAFFEIIEIQSTTAIFKGATI